MDTKRRILHLDMDAFFAAVEEKRRPELRGKPLVIGGNGDPSKRGVVSTASYAARRFGVHSAMPLRVADRLCPQCIFLPVDYEEYVRVSQIIKTILREFSPVMEDVGIDEAFLDISDKAEPSEEIARKIKTRVKEATGLTCSIGIAPNKLLAKLASDMQKPDGLTILSMEDLQDRVWPLAARKLIGVGPKTEKALQEMNISTIRELAQAPVEKLVERFGESHGNYLHAASWGKDESPMVTHWEPKSIGSETTFQQDTDDQRILRKAIGELASDVGRRLRKGGYKAWTITLKVRFAPFETHTRSKTLSFPTDSAPRIKGIAISSLMEFEEKRKIRLLGIRAERLEKPVPSLPLRQQGEPGEH